MCDLTIPALDGAALRATLFEPQEARAAVIISGATAVPRGYYGGLAAYLATLGAAVVTYDYRGSGEPPSVLRRSRARMRDWGELDAPGVIAWMRERYPLARLHLVGHSYGGHALLLAPNNHEIARAVTIASGLGYWGYVTPRERYRVYLLMRFVTPLAVAICGYSPGSRMGFGEDLAPGVAREWSRWVMNPRYFLDDPTLTSLRNGANYHGSLLMLAPSDDAWITRAAIEGLAAVFTGTQPEIREIDPPAYGVKAIGHMGFFRSANAAAWRIVSDALSLEEDHASGARAHV
ncbi:MAG TPA: alpha/beta fold hydrolase [Candidatus Baltobacteraceae bacterium]|nr:alpha/beta fold hydrolase [Candidatus Baltobacteraceae bacterium]